MVILDFMHKNPNTLRKFIKEMAKTYPQLKELIDHPIMICADTETLIMKYHNYETGEMTTIQLEDES